MLARLAELPLLVVLLGLSGAIALVPAVYAIGADDLEHARDFFYAALILLVLTVMLGIATAAYSPRDPARSHLAALVLAYAVLPFALALPLVEALPDTTLTNAWFEMISSFTTTGASVYQPDRLADAVHLWRATVGWFGGFLTLLAAYAILAPLNLGGTEVSSGRVPGRGGVGTAQIARTADPAQRLTRLRDIHVPSLVRAHGAWRQRHLGPDPRHGHTLHLRNLRHHALRRCALGCHGRGPCLPLFRLRPDPPRTARYPSGREPSPAVAGPRTAPRRADPGCRDPSSFPAPLVRRR
jgi:hypothetical protein